MVYLNPPYEPPISINFFAKQLVKIMDMEMKNTTIF